VKLDTLFISEGESLRQQVNRLPARRLAVSSLQRANGLPTQAGTLGQLFLSQACRLPVLPE
jgi:hypothetical protein